MLETKSGIYNVEYFSGSQASVYCGDVWVDEVTSIAWQCQQDRKPLYGYASTLYDAVAKGQVLVRGYFTINFKEAGYLWLILQNYKKMISRPKGRNQSSNPFKDSDELTFDQRMTIENLINQDIPQRDTNERLKSLSEYAALAGFDSDVRAAGEIGDAEDIWEEFENRIWQAESRSKLDLDRRCDEPTLNPFDIYIQYGDFAGDDNANHTIRKLSQVSIIGTSQVINSDGQPIQEKYDFIARNLI